MKNRGDNRLAVLAAEIKEADGRCRRSVEATAAAAIEAGHKLIEAKDLLPHGGWLPWLRDHAAISERTARRYMQLARSGLEIGHVADLGIRSAVQGLARQTPRRPPSPDEEAWATEMTRLLDQLPATARSEMLGAMRSHVEVERELPQGFLAALERDGLGKTAVVVRRI